MTGPAVRTTVRLAIWTAALVLAVRVLVATGGQSLSVPVTAPGELAAWVRRSPTPDMAIALLRLGAIVLMAYLLVVTALSVVARLVRLRGLVAAVDRVSPAVVRRLVSGGSGVGLALGAVAGSLPAHGLHLVPDHTDVASAASPDSVPPVTGVGRLGRPLETTATMTRVDPVDVPLPRPAGATTPVPATITAGNGATADPTAPSATMTRLDLDAPPTQTPLDPTHSATMTRVDTGTPAAHSPLDPTHSAAMTRVDSRVPVSRDDAVAPPGATADAGMPATTLPPAATPPSHDDAVGSRAATAGTLMPAAPGLPAVDAGDWVVEPGDSLWSIAEEVVRLPDGSSPGRRAVNRYWLRLIEANRPRLVDPGNADLLVPGQHLVVPPVDG